MLFIAFIQLALVHYFNFLQVVFMPDKPSFNVVGAATPALVLALPVWPGAYAMGSLAEVEMAQVFWPFLISKKRIDRYILTTFFCLFFYTGYPVHS